MVLIESSLSMLDPHCLVLSSISLMGITARDRALQGLEEISKSRL